MTLHLEKLVLDVLKTDFKVILVGKYAETTVFALLIMTNIYQANEATKPGQLYRKALLGIVQDVRQQFPPQLLVEEWLGYFLSEVYLKAESDKILIVPIHDIYHAEDYEQWLEKNQSSLPEGTMLITGLGSFVHYGAHNDGFRLRRFGGDLDSSWKLFKEYGMLNYLPLPEPARLWRLSGKSTAPKTITPTPSALFEQAMVSFDKGRYTEARAIYSEILQKKPHAQIADSASYFYAITYFKENDYQKTIEAFEQLIRLYPESTLVPEAYYHIALCHAYLNQFDQAKSTYWFVIKNFPTSNWAKYAKERMNEMTGPGSIFREAMANFDRQRWVEAQAEFSKIIKDYPNSEEADDSAFFYAICSFKQGAYARDIGEFERLIKNYPQSPLIPEAYYHIALSYRLMNNIAEARRRYQFVMKTFPTSVWAKHAQDRLKEVEGQ